MTYEPREGVDYIIDLYAVTGVERAAETDIIKSALNQRAMEYYPDRLQGVAPEFREKGERMAKLLNRARGILLDHEKRAEYDEILSEWNGPVSKDGTPVIAIERAYEAEIGNKTSDEVEAFFSQLTERIATMTGYNPRRLAFLESLIQGGGEISDELRAEYEDALLQKDTALALEEAERSRLLGLPDMDSEHYVATLTYGEDMKAKLETAKEGKFEEVQARVLGGVGTRLALLSGEASTELATAADSSFKLELPAYFEDQAARVLELAKARAELVDKRLVNWQPSYPEVELQSELQEKLIVGVSNGELCRWISFSINPSDDSADYEVISDDIKQLLNQKEFKAVIEQGYGVVVVELMEHIDSNDLIGVAIGKYTDRFKG